MKIKIFEQMKSNESKIGIILTNVPKLNDEVYSFLKRMNINPKIKENKYGSYNLWIGSVSVEAHEVGSKIDDYNVIKGFISGILDGVEKNVWSDTENCLVDRFYVKESIKLNNTSINKKFNKLK